MDSPKVNNMSNDIDYLINYRTDHLYIIDAPKKGKFIKLVDLEITSYARLALIAFYADEKEDITSFELIKITKWGEGWREAERLKINGINLNKIREFLQLISALNLKGAKKARFSLDRDIDIASLQAILGTDKGKELLKHIADNPSLSEDIFALAHKKAQLGIFENLLSQFEEYKSQYIVDNKLSEKRRGEEHIWQHFFESNPWIFGHGLDYKFLEKEKNKLESTTSGATHCTHGKRIDALMKTKALVSQYVLIEIKTPTANLLQEDSHRSGCWAASREVVEAVSQLQKTVFDFMQKEKIKVQQTDFQGNLTGEEIYKITPKSYLVIGNLKEVENNDDKFTCFELFRNSLTCPEILTYDELYERAKCIVQTLKSIE